MVLHELLFRHNFLTKSTGSWTSHSRPLVYKKAGVCVVSVLCHGSVTADNSVLITNNASQSDGRAGNQTRLGPKMLGTV